MSASSARLLSYGVPKKYADKVRRRIGYGTEGAVYELPGGKILKVNVMAPKRHSIDAVYRKIKGRKWAAPMGDRGSLSGRGFWYVSPKLAPLPRAYQNTLDDIGMMFVRHIQKGVSKAKFEAYAEDRLSKLPESLAAAVRSARRAGYRDIHGANVMMTKAGVYKVIDVESIVRGRR